jgi:hypothetical protein
VQVGQCLRILSIWPYNARSALLKNSASPPSQERFADNPSNWITSEYLTARWTVTGNSKQTTYALVYWRVADHPGVSPQVGLIVLMVETVVESAPHPEMAGLQRVGYIRG